MAKKILWRSKLVYRENHPKHCSLDFSLFSYDESIYLRDVTSYKSSAIWEYPADNLLFLIFFPHCYFLQLCTPPPPFPILCCCGILLVVRIEMFFSEWLVVFTLDKPHCWCCSSNTQQFRGWTGYIVVLLRNGCYYKCSVCYPKFWRSCG